MRRRKEKARAQRARTGSPFSVFLNSVFPAVVDAALNSGKQAQFHHLSLPRALGRWQGHNAVVKRLRLSTALSEHRAAVLAHWPRRQSGQVTCASAMRPREQCLRSQGVQDAHRDGPSYRPTSLDVYENEIKNFLCFILHLRVELYITLSR